MSLDQDSVVRLLLSSRGKVIGYISSIVGDPHLAEDVFQDVAVVSLRKAALIESEERFPGWLFKTARFKALNAYRRRKRQPQPLEDSVLDLLDAQWFAEEGEGDDPATVDALRICLGRLTDRSRQIVEFRYGQNLTGDLLARKLKKPLNTIYVALSRIYKTLAKCMYSQRSLEGYADG